MRLLKKYLFSNVLSKGPSTIGELIPSLLKVDCFKWNMLLKPSRYNGLSTNLFIWFSIGIENLGLI